MHPYHFMWVIYIVILHMIFSQDKKINAFDIRSGKLIRWFQHDGDIGNPIKVWRCTLEEVLPRYLSLTVWLQVTIDGSCSYLACSYYNRSICIYDYNSGEMVAQATGHSDLITGIVFLPDSKHLVSVSHFHFVSSAFFVSISQIRWEIGMLTPSHTSIQNPMFPDSLFLQLGCSFIGSIS